MLKALCCEFSMSKEWSKLPKIGKGYIGKPTYRNLNEIWFPVGNKCVVSSFIRYNVISCKCKIIKLNKELNCRQDSVIIDTQNDILYLAGKPGLYQIDLSKKKKVLKPKLLIKSKFIGSISTIIIDRILHIFSEETIGGFEIGNIHCHSVNGNHAKYDIESGAFDRVNIGTKPILNGVASNQLGKGESMVYIKSQMKLAFIGRIFHGESVLTYHVSHNKWKTMKRIQLKAKGLNPAGLGVVITKDQRYIIIFGAYVFRTKGTDPYCESEAGELYYDNMIEIVNLKNNSCRISNVKLPKTWRKDSYLHAFLVDNIDATDIIINAYLRDCWKHKDFLNMKKLASELIELIIQFHHQEYVHLIQRNSGKHWKISLDKILG